MKTNPIGHLVKTNPNKANLHFTAENAVYAERKGICVSACPIKKYALSYFSAFSSFAVALLRRMVFANSVVNEKQTQTKPISSSDT